MLTFTKDERLSRKKIINRLFTEGNNFSIHPFRIAWLQLPIELSNDIPVQVLFGVSKRHIHKAVTRNLMKRRMREAYRKNKLLLWDNLHNTHLAVAIIYVAGRPILFDDVQEKIILILKRLQRENEKTFG